ncbi:MAG: DUF2189 domain-containing protein [Alphaproteobacteria bacterium]|nr:DUF2189 domain-containing protein [Alphaproteobacteria bacterium]
MASIRNPAEWAVDHIKDAVLHLESVGHSLGGAKAGAESRQLTVRRIRVADLSDVLARGFADFSACRTDVIFLCFIYPVVGLLLARFAFDYDMLPLLFPAASGFALIGPVAAVGLYEMSRRREQGIRAGWADAFGTVRSPSFGAIVVLGLLLLAIFVLWLLAAQSIYAATLGPEPPSSAAAFLRDVLTTNAGWTMIAVGVGVGFLFAVLVLAISVVSFPLLLDRNVGLGTAISTSVHVVTANPGVSAVWGLIVAGSLVIGSIPLFLGLIIVMPVLGHATWHFYRKAVAR